jgi:hypothetical protein
MPWRARSGCAHPEAFVYLPTVAPIGPWCVALATRNAEFYQNRVFDQKAVEDMRPSLQPMARPWLQVYAQVCKRGLRLVTADRVVESAIDPHHVLLVAYDWTPDAARLLSQGARPAALVSFEPPVIAWELYYYLQRVSRRFPHTFLFAGARARVHPSSQFHQLYFPQRYSPLRATGESWSNRRFLSMINSNKALARARDLRRWLDRPREVSLKRLVAALRYRPILRDCYDARLRAIQAFAGLADFDLYGEAWDTCHPAVAPSLNAAARQAHRGAAADKLEVLAKYRFCLVIENTRFPGYISEKLFDCFFAGCVPIYCGAPDVTAYVPQTAFIDADKFGNWDELEQCLRRLPEDEWQSYVDAGQAFLTSPGYACFSVDHFATELADALVMEAEAPVAARSMQSDSTPAGRIRLRNPLGRVEL